MDQSDLDSALCERKCKMFFLAYCEREVFSLKSSQGRQTRLGREPSQHGQGTQALCYRAQRVASSLSRMAAWPPAMTFASQPAESRKA